MESPSQEQRIAEDIGRGESLAREVDRLAGEFADVLGRTTHPLNIWHVAAAAVALGLLDRSQVETALAGARVANLEDIQTACDRLRALANRAIGDYLGRMQTVNDHAKIIAGAAAVAGLKVKFAAAEMALPAAEVAMTFTPSHPGDRDDCDCFQCRARRGIAQFAETDV